jgi:hypothetical protein
MVHMHVSETKKTARTLALAGALAGFSALTAWAQPTPAPTTGDLACKEEAAVNPNDIVPPVADADGFYSLFNGSFKGWFQSCKTAHSVGTTNGAIFRIGNSGGKPAIYTTQRGTSTGGVMMTNLKFTNYEIRFQTWPSFGNDAGLFNRTPMNGRCFRTTLSYISGAAMGGVWGEGGFVGRDFRPFALVGNENTIQIPGNGNGEMSNWKTITSKIKATTQPNLPCPATGCTQANWTSLWDADGWNDIRVQFYGGADAASGKIHMKSWFKKPASNIWVPFIQDTTLQMVVPANRIGFQVHGGGRFGGAKGTWYRNIRWRPLDNNGNPKRLAKSSAGDAFEAESAEAAGFASGPARFSADANGLTGFLDGDYTVTLQDMQGRTLETFNGKAGEIRHAFAAESRGVLMVRLSSPHGVGQSFRVVRPF